MTKARKPGRRFEPVHFLILLFAGVILAGSVLLMLPFANRTGLSFVDAVFTATSAVCVTGLMTLNVAETFTVFGQAVIMLLMELGALGIMSVSSLFVLMLGKSISMRNSSIVHGSLTMSHHINMRKLVSSVFILMLVFELAGWAALTLLWMDDLGLEGAAWAGLFHSISAFCNAGISIFPEELTGMEKSPVVCAVFDVLIIGGSVGFITVSELYDRCSRTRTRKKWTLQTRLVLIYTALLILIGAAGFMIFEMKNVHEAKPVGEQLTSAFFHSISGRTAGFAAIDPSLYNNTTLYMLMILMFIGGASVSTAGGIKITTLAVLIGLALSRYKGHEKPHILNRSVPDQVVSHAISIVSLSVMIVALFIILLLVTESGSAMSLAQSRGRFIEIAFEVVSAFGTTGLSMGITSSLTMYGKILITLLMLIGRLGPLSIAMAVGTAQRTRTYQLSEESIMVG
ncbi:MAG: Ktr system potassium transporter B [bacterium]|nr:MAG: Ktr system potassium transporter B [bacterium]